MRVELGGVSLETERGCPQCGSALPPGSLSCAVCGFSLAPAGVSPAAAAVGRRTGDILHEKYRLRRELARGGMGVVYLADDEVLKRPVVIKTVLQTEDPVLAAQAIQEREFLATVKHPNIVAIYDFFSEGNEGFIVMEFVNGQTLLQLMEKAAGPLPPAEAVGYIEAILPALGYLHALNLVYCDFKPQNIMLETMKDGETLVKLVDLGTVMRFTDQPGRTFGTPGFCAPEALRQPSRFSDLYSVGRTLAYLVTAMDPIEHEYELPSHPVLEQHPSLQAWLDKATRPEPERRFRNATEARDQLLGVLCMVHGGTAGVPVSSINFDYVGSGRLLPRSTQALQPGDAAWAAGHLNVAVALYNQVLGAEPASLEPLVRLAEAYVAEGDFEQAQEALRRAYEVAPTHWKIAWCGGRMREAQGLLDDAARLFSEVIAELPGELPPLLALARVKCRQGQLAEAVGLYRMVQRAEPQNVEAALGLAEVHIRERRIEDAVTALQQVPASSSRYLEAQGMVAELALSLGDDGLEAAGRALEVLYGRDEAPRVYLMLGRYYALLRQTTRSVQEMVLPGWRYEGERRSGRLGALAEDFFKEYLTRAPNAPDREQVVRWKSQVAPWRWW